VTASKDPVERAVEVLVFAPLGAGLFVRDMAPSMLATFVARGRAEIDRRREDLDRRVTTVRSTGQVAVAFGVPMLRRRVEEMLGRAAAPETAPAPAPSPEPEPGPTPAVAATAAASAASAMVSRVDGPASRVPAPPSDALPIPGYDALSASQVVERLAGLAPAELDAVQAYETAHRGRRTILGKIEQLAG
jgi:hypothetical protein